MAFHVQRDGTIDCDTVAEALELSTALAGHSGNHAKRSPRAKKGTRQNQLAPNVKTLLISLRDNSDGRMTDNLAHDMNVSVSTLPPVFRGLNNWARSCHATLDELIERKRIPSKSGKLTTHFKLTSKGRDEVLKLNF